MQTMQTVVKGDNVKEEWGWIICHVSNRKKRVSRNLTRGINFKSCCCVVFLIEGEQPNFYTENIPFCQQQSSLAVLHPSSSLVCRQDSKRLSPPVHSGRT